MNKSAFYWKAGVMNERPVGRIGRFGAVLDSPTSAKTV